MPQYLESIGLLVNAYTVCRRFRYMYYTDLWIWEQLHCVHNLLYNGEKEKAIPMPSYIFV